MAASLAGQFMTAPECLPPHMHTGVPSPDLLFLASPASQAAALLWDANIHVIRSPDQRRHPTACLSMDPLCRRKPVRVRIQGDREGGGALHKDTCHSEKSSEDDVKKAPGGGRAACCWEVQMDSPCLWSLRVSQARDDSALEQEHQPPSALLPSLRCCDKDNSTGYWELQDGTVR